VALEEGNNLHTSWEPVLATISQLARLQSFADGECVVVSSSPPPPPPPSLSSSPSLSHVSCITY
jgi:hypothetical protein